MKENLTEKIDRITKNTIHKSVRLNFVNEGNKYEKIGLFGLGDWHLGHNTCNIPYIQKYINFIKDKPYARVILMGDLFEAATRSSIGSGPYSEDFHPDKQKELILELLEPIKDKIYGSHIGNHEMRILNMTSMNLTKDIARELKHKYYGFAAYTKIKLGKQQYVIYSTHGSSGATLPHTKIKQCINLGNFIDADVYLYGHVHSLDSKAIHFEQVKGRKVIDRKRYFVLTGGFLDYKDSYAEMKNMIPSKSGAPRILFYRKNRDIRIQL